MTKFNLFVISFIFAANSFAFPMFCNGKHHKASVNENGSRAQIYDRKDKPVLFGKLRCTTIFSAVVRPEGRPIVSCRTIQPVADAGLHLYVYRPHGSDKYVGKLKTQSIAGPRLIDSLNCVMALR